MSMENQSLDNDENTVFGFDSNQNITNSEFEIDDINYCLDEKDLTGLKSQGTDTHTVARH